MTHLDNSVPGRNALVAFGQYGAAHCNNNLAPSSSGSLANEEDGSWQSIVDLIFSIIASNQRTALKRKARGRHKRKLARKRSRPGLYVGAMQ